MSQGWNGGGTAAACQQAWWVPLQRMHEDCVRRGQDQARRGRAAVGWVPECAPSPPPPPWGGGAWVRQFNLPYKDPSLGARNELSQGPGPTSASTSRARSVLGARVFFAQPQEADDQGHTPRVPGCQAASCRSVLRQHAAAASVSRRSCGGVCTAAGCWRHDDGGTGGGVPCSMHVCAHGGCVDGPLHACASLQCSGPFGVLAYMALRPLCVCSPHSPPPFTTALRAGGSVVAQTWQPYRIEEGPINDLGTRELNAHPNTQQGSTPLAAQLPNKRALPSHTWHYHSAHPKEATKQ